MRMILAGAAVLSSFLPYQMVWAASGASKGQSGKSVEAPVVLVYAGAPVCKGCEEPVLDLIRQPRTPELKALAPEARVVRQWSEVPQALKALPARSIFVIPGTDDDLSAWAKGGSQAMTPASIQAIQDWLRAGGRYAGICGGAIVAQARYQDDKFAFNALNIAAMEADNFPNEDAVERIEKLYWLPTKLEFGAYFQAGSVMTLLLGEERVEILGKYLASAGKVPHPEGIAVAQFSYGQGKVFVSGVHLEATKDFWNKPPVDFVPHTELLEMAFADLMSDRQIGTGRFR